MSSISCMDIIFLEISYICPFLELILWAPIGNIDIPNILLFYLCVAFSPTFQCDNAFELSSDLSSSKDLENTDIGLDGVLLIVENAIGLPPKPSLNMM